VVIYLDAINQEKQYLYKACVKYFQEFVREWDCDETIVDLVYKLSFVLYIKYLTLYKFMYS
jgi:hypothetical protein